MESARKVLEFVRPGSEIEFSEGTEKEITLPKLINRLNYLNFQERSILVNFRHPRYSRTVTMEASPLPCLDNRLECHWTDPTRFRPNLASCSFENILIDNGHKLVVAVPELAEVGEHGAVFTLPEKSLEVNYRKTRRHTCEGVKAELLQHGARFQGTLIDFSAVSFKIEIKSSPTQALFWINPEVPVQVLFSNGSHTVYSGECRIMSQKPGHSAGRYVLEPLQSHIQRFKAKEIRSSRHQLLPVPNAVFTHPLTGKSTDLKVIDISGSGLSVQEDLEFAVLLPGMIIPDLEIRIANGFSTRCMAQVVYRQVQHHEEESDVRCGITILDMDIREHVNLLSILYLAKNKYFYMNSRVNTEELWQFFFESGFIYPAKYAFVQANKAALKEMYEKLYTENPSIARHFIYQEKGAILGHLAVLRFYENTWLVHHHAANKSESNNAGVVVLTQMIQMVNDSYNLHSAHMKYMICYYRPENKFPNRVYGGAAKSIDDKKGCSIDTFAYLHYQRPEAGPSSLDAPWSFAPATADDLLELENCYEHESGGLMLDALHLQPETIDCEGLFGEYRSLGFRMERHSFALKLGDEIKAIVTLNLSDLGLNLSDLTNCIHILVLDPEQLPKEVVEQMLSLLTDIYRQSELPVLVYPVSYADGAGIRYEKKYSLWVLDTPNHLSDVCKFLDSLTTRHKGKEKVQRAERKEHPKSVDKAGNA